MAGAIFVVAEPGARQQGPVAQLISTAGWAAAAQRVLGQSWIVTPRGVLSPGDARRRASDRALRSAPRRTWRQRVPLVAKTAVRDVSQWRSARGFTVDPDGPWTGTELAFVWQRHELFQTAGLRLADDLGLPSVLFVPATSVWEASQWGTRRPGWGGWLERRGEQPSLLRADVVACGSAQVAEQARRLGVRDDRLLITPTGVSFEDFSEVVDGGPVRRRLGLDGRFVVGWVGSFRRFHALEQAVEAAAGVPGATLLMVGDGPERPRIEQLARERGVPATFTGTVPHEQLGSYVAAMDAAVVLAPRRAPFHYSPLKLAEYMAAGRAVVVPGIGQIGERVTDGVEGLVVPPDDPDALAAALRRLRDDPAERAQLGRAARIAAEDGWSWDHQLRRLVDEVAPMRGRPGQATPALD